ncbi:MAG: PAS domain-containing protein [Anaerolineales bacterium]|nr:PAS domain-containing protein [Anaerolineales bacterium]
MMTESPEQEKIRTLEAQVAHLKLENARLRTFLETATELSIVLDKHGRYQDIFAATSNNGLLVQPAEEVIGLTLHDIFPEPAANQFLALIQAALATGQTQTLTYAAQTLSGSRWFLGQIQPLSESNQETLQDLVLFVAQDITEQKRLAEDLQTSQDRFRFLADSAAVGIFESDLGGQIH